MSVRGINTLQKLDIKLVVVMIFFWHINLMICQVDINNSQVNTNTWQVDIIIWQVMAEICHHTELKYMNYLNKMFNTINN